MPPIGTFVVMDLETTDFARPGTRRSKITEIAMMAASRESILTAVWDDTRLPRVAHKILFCVHPNQLVSTGSANITGLNTTNLRYENKFDKELVLSIKLFLRRLTPPICLLAHNGFRFDFPILRAELHEIGESLPDDLLCADSLDAFQTFFPLDGKDHRTVRQENNMGSPHETSRTLINHKLPTLFQYVYSEDLSTMNAHSAEGDVEALMKCIVVECHKFVEWADVNARTFNGINRLW